MTLNFHPDRLNRGVPIHLRLKPGTLARATFCYPRQLPWSWIRASGGTPVEHAAGRLGCLVDWHAGFRLSIEEMQCHGGYRGAEFVELGSSLAFDGYLDPRVIGDAARSGLHDEQDLKRVWHYVARYGPPDDVPRFSA